MTKMSVECFCDTIKRAMGLKVEAGETFESLRQKHPDLAEDLTILENLQPGEHNIKDIAYSTLGNGALSLTIATMAGLLERFYAVTQDGVVQAGRFKDLREVVSDVPFAEWKAKKVDVAILVRKK